MLIKKLLSNKFLTVGGLMLTICVFWSFNLPKGPPRRVLVFSKTTGFRHLESIPAGQAALFKMGNEHGFAVDTTEDAASFTDDNLKRYQAVIFLNVSGELFNPQQRTSLKRYIQAGGGFLAIHASTDAERDWPWYGGLIGGYFDSHPPTQQAIFKTIERSLPGLGFLPDSFERTDELYNFQQVNPAINVLVNVDEKTYRGGNMGDKHPMVWYHDYDGGRSFYTAMGHTKQTYAEPIFINTLWAGLHWVMGGDRPKPLDYALSMPEDNRFSRNELLTNLEEPMQMAFADNGDVYFVERRGKIKRYSAKTKQGVTVGTIPVFSNYEDGLLGLALDPQFQKNHWLYVFYTHPNGQAFQISRFTVDPQGTVNYTSEKSLLQIPKQILDGSHTGGALLFDPRGTGDLFITIGDNSSPRQWPYSPIDERPDRIVWDAQRSSANTNDLRGKILRIHPEANGTYTVPKGNLFPVGTAKTRPEIYSMGHRQPWRLAMDTKTGWLYLGEVGPDSRKDSVGLGPAGHDEFNQIRHPGNYGWPYFIGNNKAYWAYDFSAQKSGSPFRADNPVNNSPNNTGLTQLPPAQSSLIWYPYSKSQEFPLLGTGGRSATGGPVFRKADFKTAQNTFPAYYEGKWFIADWLRGWIRVVSLNEAGEYKSMEPFMADHKFSNPIDMQFGADGSLYVLEYGAGWFKANEDARLVRIDYNAGNRPPIAVISADKVAGSVPFTTQLSAKGSFDYDKDTLTYSWKITSKAGKVVKMFKEKQPILTLKEVGIYTATLTIKDAQGAVSTKSLEIKAGNEPPVIAIDVTEGNKTFVFPDSKIGYAVRVRDKEDGSLEAGTIVKSKVAVRINYDGGGSPPQRMGHQEEEMGSKQALVLLRGSDCYACHDTKKKSVGPAFVQVAERYKGNPLAAAAIIRKIREGGSGAWGQVAMSAHPDMKPGDAGKIVDYILSLTNEAEPAKNWPSTGHFTAKVPVINQQTGEYRYVVQASYTDTKVANVPVNTSWATLVLKSPRLILSQAAFSKSVMHFKTVHPAGEQSLLYGPFAYLGFPKIDLTGIGEIYLNGNGKGSVEVRLDSPTGLLIGQSEPVPERDTSSTGKGPSTFRVLLKEASGLHDLYFVSNVPAADAYKVVFDLRTVEFKQRKGLVGRK